MHRIFIVVSIIFLTIVGYLAYSNQQTQTKNAKLSTDLSSTQMILAQTKKELDELKGQDQVKINADLKAEIANIEKTYSDSIDVFDGISDLKAQGVKTSKLDTLFADAINKLSKRDFSGADKELKDLSGQISTEKGKIAAANTPAAAPAPASNIPPSSGYSRQSVHTDAGDFVVAIISGDLNSTRVIIDTASDGTCTNDCPVLALGDYVSRSGAYAGVNGSYFCPEAYPQCAGKTNSFDTLLMNKNKVYFNSDNNVYSSVPAAIFYGNTARFVGASSEWGRDTSVDAVIANQPLLVSGGNVVFGGSSDPKQGSVGPRSFVASKGSTAYIGVVFNATVAESALAMKALGMDNALNLDSGGSTALWSGGYKVGPGRNIPNAVLFVSK